MKKLIILIFLIIFMPYFIVTIFIEDKEIKFNYIKNDYIRVKRVKQNIIENIPLEEYVVGVLAGEMPVSFKEEALKAQSVAARTYALKHINKSKEYDVVDTIDDQVFFDNEELMNRWKDKYITNINKLKEAVYATKGEYLTYNNEIITAFFFSTSNGKTENCEEVFKEKLPYLRSVDSSWDMNVSPVYNDTKQFTLKDFYEKLNINYNEKLEINIKEHTKTGSVKTIEINGKNFKGTDVRFKLGLRSTYFSISVVNNDVVIKTRGNGHGVGMSQYGALAMANLGYTYDQILKYYYTDVEIKKI